MFNPTQLSALRDHGIVLFADRVIYDAQPPMSDSDIAKVQRQCAGILPPQLIRLWQSTAGGSLDYGLSLRMRGNQEAISWTELFYNDSSGYRDLQGWIDHELELLEQDAKENGKAFDGKLTYLPIGGFEYLDRIYICVTPGSEYGHVIAWKHGLPPAWRHRLHNDSIATVASDLELAFRALGLDEDPLNPVEEYFSGDQLLNYVEERKTEHGLDPDLAHSLIEFYRRAIIDWRPLLANQTINDHLRACNIAINHAIITNNRQLIVDLARAGVGFDSSTHGSAVPIEVAVTKGAMEVATELLAQSARTPPSILDEINAVITSDLVSAFLDKGANPSLDAAAQCVSIRENDCATLIIEAHSRKGRNTKKEFEIAKGKLLAEHEESLIKVRAGKLHHYLCETGLEQRIAALKEFNCPDPKKSGLLRTIWTRS